MNPNMLKAFMAKNGDTQRMLAHKIGLSLSRFNAKINANNGAEFTQSEIIAIAKLYNLTSEDITGIFFTT